MNLRNRIMRNRIKSKKGVSLTVKSMFAIFLVVFVFFMFFSLIKSKNEALIKKEYFGSFSEVNNYFQAMIGNPQCLTKDDLGGAGLSLSSEGLLSKTKLDKYSGWNRDISCVENYDFLYTLQVKDLDSGKLWNIGINDTDPEVAKDMGIEIVQRDVFVSVFYRTDEINFGKAIFKAYYSQEIDFYSAIKKACALKRNGEFSLETFMDISYDDENAAFCIHELCFIPEFQCIVNSFDIPEGSHLVYLKYEDNVLDILI
ncbi:MAG: hypothetical protein KKF44_07990 [Nanoarchaeota archaeon]|nr:hypothetical protein [Nanoarchaeota archaeon]